MNTKKESRTNLSDPFLWLRTIFTRKQIKTLINAHRRRSPREIQEAWVCIEERNGQAKIAIQFKTPHSTWIKSVKAHSLRDALLKLKAKLLYQSTCCQASVRPPADVSQHAHDKSKKKRQTLLHYEFQPMY